MISAPCIMGTRTLFHINILKSGCKPCYGKRLLGQVSPARFSPDRSVRDISVLPIQSQINSVLDISVPKQFSPRHISPTTIQSQTIQSQDTSVPEFSVQKFSVPDSSVPKQFSPNQISPNTTQSKKFQS